MRGLPSSWVEVNLGDLLSEGLSNGRSVRDRVNGFPVLRLTSLKDGRVDRSEHKEGAWDEEEASRFLVAEGDLLVARGNGSLRLVGRAGLVAAGEPAVAYPDTLIRVRVNHELVDAKFLLHSWNSPYVRRQLEAVARTTAGIYKVNQTHLKGVSLRVPPLPEQRQIVAELEQRLAHIHAAETGLNRARVLLQTLRRSVLNGLVTGSLLGADSTGWPLRRVGDLGAVKGGIQKQPKREPVDNSFPFLRVANVARGALDLSDVHQVELFAGEVETYRLVDGDLLVVEGNGSIDQIGRAALWEGAIPDCVHQNHLIRVRPGPDVLPRFLALAWNSPAVAEQLVRVASSTSGLHTLSTSKVANVTIALPDLQMQSALVTEADRRLQYVIAAARSVENASRSSLQLRRALLHAAFSGRMVPQRECDRVAPDPVASRVDRSSPPSDSPAHRSKEVTR